MGEAPGDQETAAFASNQTKFQNNSLIQLYNIERRVKTHNTSTFITVIVTQSSAKSSESSPLPSNPARNNSRVWQRTHAADTPSHWSSESEGMRPGRPRFRGPGQDGQGKISAASPPDLR
uniref:Uncharacterized protein n=1 Tax=Branchiostoma floridae TaxID=7739 RepID=C3YVB9_BRAFL|eukprot:XP_002599823.1 hypothetical protein BRAFLDRAFT_70291 [Branchiostoma floridae]